MKYEEYRKLAPQQKEEWQFRFKDKFETLIFGARGVAHTGILFMLIITNFLFLIVLIAENPDLAAYKSEIANILSTTMHAATLWGIIIFAEIFLGIASSVFLRRKERKWLKTQGASS